MIKSFNQDSVTAAPVNNYHVPRVPPPGVPIIGTPVYYTPDNQDDRYVWLYSITGGRYGGL
jgi:hypothetical protein